MEQALIDFRRLLVVSFQCFQESEELVVEIEHLKSSRICRVANYSMRRASTYESQCLQGDVHLLQERNGSRLLALLEDQQNRLLVTLTLVVPPVAVSCFTDSQALQCQSVSSEWARDQASNIPIRGFYHRRKRVMQSYKAQKIFYQISCWAFARSKLASWG